MAKKQKQAAQSPVQPQAQAPVQPQAQAPRAQARQRGSGAKKNKKPNSIARDVRTILGNTNEIIKLLKAGSTSGGGGPNQGPVNVAAVKAMIRQKIKELEDIEDDLEDKYLNATSFKKQFLASLQRERATTHAQLRAITDNDLQNVAAQGPDKLKKYHDDIVDSIAALLKAINDA